uniref:Uncharacterized protein n=1 Tax=Siphoviridae sp. ctWlk2 TaxID=2825539 RepID=A0A8S5U6L6_9CAUD|nr:MAG TPA: hypothetical protein [Siphoviridae sp. ctWlk2]
MFSVEGFTSSTVDLRATVETAITNRNCLIDIGYQ